MRVSVRRVVLGLGEFGGVLARPAGQESRDRANARGGPLLAWVFALFAVAAVASIILIVGLRLLLVFAFVAGRSIVPKRHSTRHRRRLRVSALGRVSLFDFLLIGPFTGGRRIPFGRRAAFAGVGLPLGVGV